MAGAGAAVGAGGLLAACGSSGSPATSPKVKSTAPKRGGNLIVGLSGSSGADTLDPHKGLTYLDTARAQSLYQPLLQLSTAASIEYVLAESIEPRTKDNTEFVIKLQPGITFHNGKSLGAEDVIFTFRRIKANAFAGADSLGPMDVKGLKAMNKHTVLVPFTRPFGSFVDQLAYWYYLYIVPDGYSPNAPPNGTGPFVHKSFTQNQRSVFTKNPNYWKPGRPYVDSLTIIDFSDNVALVDALTTGTVQGAGALEGPQLASLANTQGVKTVASHTGAIIPFTMRVDQAPFDDVNFRQAIRYAIDRPALIESALDGYAVVGNDVFSPYDPDFDRSLAQRRQDIPFARHLLKKSGKEGITVTLTTAPATTGMVSMATVLAQQVSAAGIKVKINQVNTSTFFGTGKYLNWTFSQDFYNFSPYLAQVAQSMLGTASPFNETHTDNKHYTGLYDQANAASAGSVKGIVTQMQQFDYNQGGYIIPAFIDALDAYSTKIAGYSRARVGQPLSDFDFENMYFV
jgi:peptide/nickel transport system substrate-binding protein